MLKEIEISSFGIRFELEKEINHLRSVVYNNSTPRLHSNNWDGSRSASQNTNRDSVLISPPSQMVSSQTEKPYRSLDNLQNPARIRKSSTSNRPASTIISSESYNRRPSEIHSLSSRVPTGGLSVPGSNNSSNPNFNPALYAVPVDEILKDGTIFESPEEHQNHLLIQAQYNHLNRQWQSQTKVTALTWSHLLSLRVEPHHWHPVHRWSIPAIQSLRAPRTWGIIHLSLNFLLTRTTRSRDY